MRCLACAFQALFALDRAASLNPLYRLPRDLVLDRLLGPVEEFDAPLTR